MKSFIKSTIIILVVIFLIYFYFKEYRPKAESYDKLKTEEQVIIKELNSLRKENDSLKNVKSDNMTKYTYETMQKELNTDSIRIWKTEEGVKLEVKENKIFKKKKSDTTEEGDKILNKLLSSIANSNREINIEILIDNLNGKSAVLKVQRGLFLMEQLVNKYNIKRDSIKINVLLVQKGLSGINIELK